MQLLVETMISSFNGFNVIQSKLSQIDLLRQRRGKIPAVKLPLLKAGLCKQRMSNELGLLRKA